MKCRFYTIIFFLHFFQIVLSQYSLVEYEKTIRVNENDKGDKEYSQILFKNEKLYGLKMPPILNKKIEIDTVSANLVKRYGSVYFFENNEFYETLWSPKPYFTLDELPDIAWVITDHKKNILGYGCIEAKGKFRGRDYQVWFAQDIPVRYGPWKLNGLPGLILEAETEDHFFHWMATKISLNFANQVNDAVGKYAEEMKNAADLLPYKEFVPLRDAYYEEIESRELANFSKGNIVSHEGGRNFALEKSFEWEETK